MKFYNCYNRCLPKIKAKIFQYIRTWFRTKIEHQPKIKNLYNEHFLKETVMEEILHLLQNFSTSDYDTNLSVLISHGYNNLCKGDLSIISTTALVVGSVIGKNQVKQG